MVKKFIIQIHMYYQIASNLFWWFLWQQKHLYNNKSSWTYAYFIFAYLHFLLPCPYLYLISWIQSARLSIRFDNALAINLVVSINFNLQDMIFDLRFFPLLPILFTSLVIRTWKVMYSYYVRLYNLVLHQNVLLALL